MVIVKDVLDYLSAIILASGVLTILNYLAFRVFATKWIEAKFNERLQDLKHKHGKEVENLRFQIASLLDRTTKLHQREFEALPEAWAKLTDAYWTVKAFVHPAQQYPDIEKMVPSQQEEFIDACRLTNWQKDELRASAKKNDAYISMIFWCDAANAKDKARDAHLFFVKNGIFISEHIRKALEEILELIWAAFSEREFNERHKIIPRIYEKTNDFLGRGDDMIKALEGAIHERLWPKDSVAL